MHCELLSFPLHSTHRIIIVGKQHWSNQYLKFMALFVEKKKPFHYSGLSDLLHHSVHRLVTALFILLMAISVTYGAVCCHEKVKEGTSSDY